MLGLCQLAWMRSTFINVVLLTHLLFSCNSCFWFYNCLVQAGIQWTHDVHEMTRNKMTRNTMTHNTMTWCTNHCRWLRLHRHRSGNPWRHRTPADRWRNDICRRGMAPDVSCGSRCLKCKENVRINQWKCRSPMEMSESNANVGVQWKCQSISIEMSGQIRMGNK